MLDGQKLSQSAGDYFGTSDVVLHIQNQKVTVEDIERLIAIGRDVRLTDCQFDEASLQRLANHASEPDFVIRSPDMDDETIARLNSSTVHVLRTESR